MHILVLLMMVALIAHDSVALQSPSAPAAWQLIAVCVAPNLLFPVLFSIICRSTHRVLVRDLPARGRLKFTERMDLICRVCLALSMIGQVYGLGWLSWLREALGDVLIIPELCALAMPLTAMTVMWAFYYPIDRQLRTGRSTGDPVDNRSSAEDRSRGYFVLAQFRHQVVLMLAPLMAILAWTQMVDRWIAPHLGDTAALRIVTYSGFLLIFASAPEMIRWLWDTAPLPDGPLRMMLTGMCERYRVGVRQLLLWRTYGGMINGAVIGLIGPLRYILLSDGLLSRMTPTEIEAVMAHELGHIRRRHMPWLIVCAAAVLYAIEVMISLLIHTVEALNVSAIQPLLERHEKWVTGLTLVVIVGLWLVVFGYISRRFERQADTFALQHFSRADGENDAVHRHSQPVTDLAVEVYSAALRRVASLNRQPLRKRSWRHGSLQWRIQYLSSLIDTPIDRCPIDRQMRLIRWGCAVTLAALVIYDLAPTILER